MNCYPGFRQMAGTEMNRGPIMRPFVNADEKVAVSTMKQQDYSKDL